MGRFHNKISVLPQASLCIRLLDADKNVENNSLPGCCAEISPISRPIVSCVTFVLRSATNGTKN